MMLARTTPLKRKSWLTAKAPLVRLVRSKPKPRKATTAVERRHLDRIAASGCLVCGCEATIHHVTSDGYQRLTRTHERVVPLCPRHHMIQWGPKESVEALGHAGFTVTYGIDLLAVAKRLWAEGQLIEKGL